MDKITLKELAPYLPYGLNVLSPKHKINYGERTPLLLNGLSFQKSLGDWQYEFIAHDGDLIFGMVNDTTYTPLLRPLSDLTKPITHNGETVNLWDDLLSVATKRELKRPIKQTPIDYTWIPFISYHDTQILLQHHFDVFGLIGRGLALPVEEKI